MKINLEKLLESLTLDQKIAQLAAGGPYKEFVTDGNITYYEARNVSGVFTFSMPQKKSFIMK